MNVKSNTIEGYVLRIDADGSTSNFEIMIDNDTSINPPITFCKYFNCDSYVIIEDEYNSNNVVSTILFYNTTNKKLELNNKISNSIGTKAYGIAYMVCYDIFMELYEIDVDSVNFDQLKFVTNPLYNGCCNLL